MQSVSRWQLAACRPKDVGLLLLRDVVPVDDVVVGRHKDVPRTDTVLSANGRHPGGVGSDLAADEDGPRCDGCRRGASL